MLIKPLLFLSSYAPLFGLLAIRFEPPVLWISCVVLAVLGVAALVLLLQLDRRVAAASFRLVEVRDAGAEAAAYLASYLLPFLTVATPTAQDVVAYVGFLLIAASVHVQSSLLQVNPLLYVLGYRVLAVVDAHGLRAYLITRASLHRNAIITATRFSDDVLVSRP